MPRMRITLPVTGTVSPSGTKPPSESSSSRAKSTRNAAQQAPHVVQNVVMQTV